MKFIEQYATWHKKAVQCEPRPLSTTILSAASQRAEVAWPGCPDALIVLLNQLTAYQGRSPGKGKNEDPYSQIVKVDAMSLWSRSEYSGSGVIQISSAQDKDVHLPRIPGIHL